MPIFTSVSDILCVCLTAGCTTVVCLVDENFAAQPATTIGMYYKTYITSCMTTHTLPDLISFSAGYHSTETMIASKLYYTSMHYIHTIQLSPTCPNSQCLQTYRVWFHHFNTYAWLYIPLLQRVFICVHWLLVLAEFLELICMIWNWQTQKAELRGPVFCQDLLACNIMRIQDKLWGRSLPVWGQQQ